VLKKSIAQVARNLNIEYNKNFRKPVFFEYNLLNFTGGIVMQNNKMFQNMMKQIENVGTKVSRLQEELANKTVSATSGGGMVTVTANGQKEIVSIKIEKDVVNPDDVELLEDLVCAAVNEALFRCQEMISNEMSKLTGGLKIPGLM
jgi:DNA-binding YbaB/EbfC family protein